MLIKKKLITYPVNSTKINNDWTCGAAVTDNILVIDFHKCGTHKYRYYYDNNNFIIYNIEQKEWMANNYINCELFDKRYSFLSSLKINTDKISIKLIQDFLKTRENNIGSILESISYKKYKLNKKQKLESLERRIDKHTNDVCHTLSAKETIELNNNLFNNYLFVTNVENGKRYGKCSCCGKKFSVDKNIKHKTTIHCPKCNRLVTVFFKRYVSSIKEKKKICRIENIDNRITYSYANISRHIDDKLHYKFEYDVYAILTEDYPKNKSYKKWYGYSNKAVNFCGRYWHDTVFLPYECCYTLTTMVEQVYGSINHINIKEYIGIRPYINAFNVIYKIKKMPELEYLYKLGLYNLLEEIPLTYNINKGAKNFSEALGVYPEYISIFKKVDIKFKEIQVLKRLNYVVDSETILKARVLGIFNIIDNYQNNRNINKLLSVCKLKKLVNYAEKQSIDSNKFRIYLDYICMCDDLNIDINNKTILYPKDYKEAHDKLTTKIKLAQAQVDKSKSKKLSQLVIDKKLDSFCENGLCIVVPITHEDLIKEGEALCHCVGSNRYWLNHKEQKSMIFFIRKINEPDVPYVTMEINMQNLYIVQIYEAHDNPPEEFVKNFGNSFCAYLKKQLKYYNLRGASNS